MPRLPNVFAKLQKEYPDVVEAYERFGRACSGAGPLDGKTSELVKVALALGAGLEGGVHSHVRRALQAGAKPEELRHIAVLGFTTIGFPASMSGMTWIDDIVTKRASP